MNAVIATVAMSVFAYLAVGIAVAVAALRYQFIHEDDGLTFIFVTAWPLVLVVAAINRLVVWLADR